MDNFDLKAALDWLGAIVISIGGASVVVVALVKWSGDRLASKLLEKDRAKYQRELEGIKANYQQELEGLKARYQQELESKKVELEKSKSFFLRYSEHQFTLYNDLWISLCDLKNMGDELWESCTPKKVKDFSKQLKITKSTVEKSALLIEDSHYLNLIRILEQFEQFQIGKMTLLQLRTSTDADLALNGVTENLIREVINRNRMVKNEFTTTVTSLLGAFKHQIKGEPLQ